MEIEYISKSELVEYASRALVEFDNHLPVSPERAHSQSLNPHAKADDILLITAREEKNLLSFIGIYPSWVQGNPNKRIFWVSCWWKAQGVSPEISRRVFREFMDLYGRFAGLPHLPPHIIRTLEKHGLRVEARQGFMIRFRSALHERSLQKSLKGKYRRSLRVLRSSRALRIYDYLKNVVNESSIISKSGTIDPEFLVKRSIPEDDYFNFIKENFKDYLSLPDRQSITWICNHPWLVEPEKARNSVIQNYHFSYVTRDFHHFFPILKKKGKIKAAGFLSSRDGAVKTLHLFVLPGFEDHFFTELSKYIQINSNYHTLITYDPGYYTFLNKNKIHRSNAEEITRYTAISNPEYYRLSTADADGDSCFT
jgi:hypothetical protein